MSYNIPSTISDVRQNATKVHIFNATVHTFNADIDDWATLESLSVIGGQINKINGQFSGNLACVNFSQNNISEISTSAFKNLPKLKILDLSKNNVSNIPNITSTKHNLRLDISSKLHMTWSIYYVMYYWIPRIVEDTSKKHLPAAP